MVQGASGRYPVAAAYRRRAPDPCPLGAGALPAKGRILEAGICGKYGSMPEDNKKGKFRC